MDEIRHYKRLIRNTRRSREVAAKLRDCETGYGYRLVPVDVFNDAVELLTRFGGGTAGEHKGAAPASDNEGKGNG